MRKFLWVAALAALALPRIVAAACDTSGLLVNGFEGVASSCGYANDIVPWTAAPVGAALVAVQGGVAGSTYPNPEGDFYGRAQWAAQTLVTHTLAGASFNASVGQNWSGHGFLHVAYATTTTATSLFAASLILTTPTANTLVFSAGTTDLTRTTVSTASDWAYLILSLDYARNLGIDLSSIAQVQIQQKRAVPGTANIAYDYLAVTETPVSANLQVPSGQIFTTSGCNGFTISWTAQVKSGTDEIYGYHIYRATTATGPWVSLQYVTGGATTFVETVPISPSQYYVIFPFATTTTAYVNGSMGAYLGTNFDSRYTGGYGVFEGALTLATAAGPFNPFAGCSPTPSLTPSMSSTFTPTKSATPTISPTATNSPTMTNTPTASPSPTNTPSNTASPTISPTITLSGTLTQTPNGSFTYSPTTPPTPTVSPTVTPTPSVTLSNTPVPPASTNTVSPTISPTFTNTTGVPGPGTQIYPNPFNPDKGEVFHIGNVTAGDTMTIYNMIGELVYSVRLKGNPSLDSWDALNNNGVKVVTGVYFLVLSGSQNQVFRVAVVRETK